jgi:C1A family cysteine protease
VDCPGTLVDTDSAHCVIVVGYDDPSRRLIVRNSWGPAWGDRGYCYLDYGYIEQGYVFQAFTAL